MRVCAKEGGSSRVLFAGGVSELTRRPRDLKERLRRKPLDR